VYSLEGEGVAVLVQKYLLCWYKSTNTDAEGAGSVEDSLEGEGVLMMAVDILPAELPREASSHFGNLLVNLVRPLLNSDATSPLQEQATLLPPALHSAIITCSGKLAPNFAYIQKMCEERERNRTRELAKEHRVANCDAAHTTHVLLRGHLFDTGLINRSSVYLFYWYNGTNTDTSY